MKGCELFEFRCAVCGKTVCTLDPISWTYKICTGEKQKKFFCCSWHCLQKLPNRNVKGRKSGRGSEIFGMLDQGKTKQEIMKETGISPSTYKYWMDKYKSRKKEETA